MCLDDRPDVSRERLIRALEQAGGNRRKAAELLGVGRATLYRWLERHAIDGGVLRRIGDRYDVIDVLGQGSQATVYLVRDRAGKLGEKALKLLHAERLDKAAVERLRQEFRVLSLLRHPGLVRVHDFGVDGATARPFLVMDRVDGRPFVESSAGRSPQWVAEALAQTLTAVDHLHRAGLVHRDLKSQNVVILAPVDDADPPRIVVMDLGLAENLAGPQEAPGGTLLYAAPEICTGSRASVRTDLYAIGVLGYLSLTGRFPFQGETVEDVIAAAQRGQPASPSTLRPEIPALLDDVIQRLLAADPGRRPPDCGAVLEALAPLRGSSEAADGIRRQVEFVGREAQLAEILRWAAPLLERSNAGPSCLTIVGDSGIGKTRLLEAAIDELRANGHRVAQAACREGVQEGMTPVAEVLAEALVGADGAGDTAQDRILRRYAPALGVAAPDLRIAGAPAAAGVLSRSHALDSVASLLMDLGELRPLIVALDDVHLADAFVLDLVWHLARRGRRAPLKVIVSCRPPAAPDSPLGALLEGAAAEGLTQALALGPLDRAAVRRMADQTIGAARAAVLDEQLWKLTGGQPLWVHELLRTVIETGVEHRGESELPVPQSVRETICARLERLPEHSRLLSAALAAAGRPANAIELEQVVGRPVADAAADLQRRGVLQHDADGRMSFIHAPVRDAVLELLAAEDRREWRRRWAAFLEGRPDALVERAGHLLAAGAGAEAREEFLAAAGQLTSSWQLGAAVRFLKAVLDSHAPGDPARLTYFPRLEHALRELHDRGGAIKVCAEWAELACQLDERKSESQAQSALAAHLREMCLMDQALRAAERAVELAEGLHDPAAAARAHKIRASLFHMSWRHAEAGPSAARALALAREADDKRLLAFVLHDLALWRAVTGRRYAGLNSLAEARALLREIGDRVWEQHTRTNEGLIRPLLGDLGGAIEGLEQSIAEIRGSGADAPVEFALENLTFLLNRSGRYTNALRVGQELLEEATRLGRHSQRLAALLCLGEAFFQLDERDIAREHHRLAYELAATLGEERQRLFAALARVRDLREEGRIQPAAELAQQVFDAAGPLRAMRQRMGAAVELARIALDELDAERAQRWLDEAESATAVLPDDGPAIRAALLLERSRAWERQKETTLALAAVDEALGLAIWRGPADVEIKLHAQRARLLDQRGQSDAAARALARAAARATEIAELQTDPVRRSRYLSRPDLQVILAAARRRATPSVSSATFSVGGPAALASLYEVARSVAAGGDLDPLLDRIVQLAVECVGAERALLLLRDELSGELRPAASTGVEKETEQDAIEISRSVLQKADQGGSVLIADALSDVDLRQAVSVALFGIRSVMCVPLRAGSEVLGTLYVDERRTNAFFTAEHLRFLEALADQAAIGLAYGRLVGRLSQERNALRKTAVETHRFGALVGRGPAMRRVFDLLEKVAPTRVPVLILGESGTGKELAARAVHFNSPRCDAPILSENCAAIPETLLESILFGHVRGAFTGADRDRKGLFELADGGSLFLDEIGDMSPGLQAKLLRALQEGEFRPLGGEQVVRSDVRVITATHRDLPTLVQEGAFRSDLYFRLNGVTIQLPPLRERKEDIPLLVQHFLEKETHATGREPPRVAPPVMRALISHDWPGNVRQLENSIRRLLLFAPGDEIAVETLAEDPELGRLVSRDRRGSAPTPTDASGPGGEAAAVRRALELTGGDKEQAAAVLGISRATFYRKLKRLGLNP